MMNWPFLSKSYEPDSFESEVYHFWEEHGFFKASDESKPKQEAFCMVIPPPNVTGVLHMGHALTNTIQDILVRWRRMHGDNTLWLPGTDHAGISTQVQVEKSLSQEKNEQTGRPWTRQDLGREKFVARVWQWKEQHGNLIKDQLKCLGSSLDWSRERFTLDEGLSCAVREVFVRLFEEGLIYRGDRIINWCPRCQTALSDLEVIPTERKGHLWHLLYRVVDKKGCPVLNSDGSPEQVVIATTRPETLLGDTAVAFHPDDERYRAFHGQSVVLPLLGKIIPIILDSYVDREFGSGALKVTPAHDFNDYELGQRHQLETVSVMGKDGRITSEGGSAYAGLKFAEAREKIIQDLKDANLLVKVEDHTHQVGLCDRCNAVAEPMVSKQWFVKMAPLAKPAIEAVETGKIMFAPKSWERTYFEWMHHIRDWCISRQLWWGHQIPAWYCKVCSAVTVAREIPLQCSQCQVDRSQLNQDEDVLDTWFSSALWPFSTLGWPEKTQALMTFYPTSILETGFDIIFFWVARMIMMGLHFMGEVPFRKVYLHAMVRDEKGDKMSKTKGNGMNPLDLIQKYGADPLRFTLAIMAGQGRDIKLSVDRVEGYRAFCNKLWNAVKFFHLQFESEQGGLLPEPEMGLHSWIKQNKMSLSLPDRWILSRLQAVIEKVEAGLAHFELNLSSQALYDFTWHELCDWYIEFSKHTFRQGGEERKKSLFTLGWVLEELLKAMHPFMPFVTEKLWHSLPWKKESTSETLMLQSFPKLDLQFLNLQAEASMSSLQELIEALRNFRGENRISPQIEFEVSYLSATQEADQFVLEHASQIQSLARISKIFRLSPHSDINISMNERQTVIPLSRIALELRVNLKGLVNEEEEQKRLRKEIEKIKNDLNFVRNKLSQSAFIDKAPAALVLKERTRESDLVARCTELENTLKRLISE